MYRKNVSFKNILSAVQGKSGYERQRFGRERLGRYQRGHQGLRPSKMGDRRVSDYFIGDTRRQRARLARSAPSGKQFYGKIKGVMKDMGYTEKQIQWYLNSDNPKKAGMAHWKTTEKLVNEMRKRDVPGFREMDELTRGSDYARRVMTTIGKQRRAKQLAERTSVMQHQEARDTVATTDALGSENAFDAHHATGDMTPLKALPSREAGALTSGYYEPGAHRSGTNASLADAPDYSPQPAHYQQDVTASVQDTDETEEEEVEVPLAHKLSEFL
jgi:hypothetical protein